MTEINITKIGVLGAGSWGTALAVSMLRTKKEVLIWSRSEAVTSSINNERCNNYLPDMIIPEGVSSTNNINDVIKCDVLLIVIPAQTIRENCEALKNAGIGKNVPLVICCKGIEIGTEKLMSEVVKEVLPENPIAILSGPNFANEVANGLPTCTTLACEEQESGMRLVEALGCHVFRTYYTNDIIGAQIGGAVKNVLAIACGIATGKGLGENARAAIVTRGMAEITRLCVAKGGKAETLMGLSGIGDIMLTCGSRTSRNMSFGYELGKGVSVKELTDGKAKLAEGVATAKSVSELARSLGVDMPICYAVNDIIFNNADIDKVVMSLLSRPLTVE
ncbi:MAG: NAD(P)H-dependent glycerol-3-phosphate dehydrogenase [Rickettsiales bacterium]|nr:NAD(P)H-dependent glycerol-3-phosphate dehydrogenase [Pseudomonadota bacterium]MDA0965456.1 NAD(P)H-dependent glycerol-3-phosphate dehydrogenase [Pseudomonadota bacterium]MDG4542781.1 NAD(P)H-dependent glycerol-3-phosphate dehydrogenase [Rickettsiales bacterium]MDG4544771.1 NAD(P)H-dependent glycerol-3-phosphate dehydrogenase [Rickettsiales bacterium]MDG4546893.1 NAD(P)H-dependent glycerol-3-phosphate dehydrogenase [Rickettsiales bacterium]